MPSLHGPERLRPMARENHDEDDVLAGIDDAGSVVERHLEDAFAVEEVAANRRQPLLGDAVVALELQVLGGVVVGAVHPRTRPVKVAMAPARFCRDDSFTRATSDPERLVRVAVVERVEECIQVEVVGDGRRGHLFARVVAAAEGDGRDSGVGKALHERVVVVGAGYRPACR